MLLEHGAGLVVVLDLSREMLVNAKAKGLSGAFFVEGDAENLPFKSGAFDLGYVAMSMHHLPNHKQAVMELSRTSRSVVIFDIMNPLVTKIAMRFGYGGNEGEHGELKINRVNAKEVVQVLQHRGDQVSVRYFFDFDLGSHLIVYRLTQGFCKLVNILLWLSRGTLGSAFGVLAIIRQDAC